MNYTSKENVNLPMKKITSYNIVVDLLNNDSQIK